MTAKQTLISALAEHCRRNTPSLADAHVADAIEALIDERIGRFMGVHNSELSDAERADIEDSIREMREEMAKLE